jgi:tetratricopeptide (TPR) repeat protein
LAFYDGILESDPKNTRAVNALEKIYAQMGRYEELLTIYSRRLEMAEDDEERKEILFNQALLWEEEVQDGSKAIDVLLQIVDMAGDEPRVLSALNRLYTTEERWPECVDVIERELNAGVEEQEAELDLKFRLGQISEIQLTDKEKALHCYRDILSVDSEHEMAKAALESLLEDEGQQQEAARILAPIYEARDEWENLVGAIEILVKHEDDAFEKYENLLKIGGIYAAQLASPEQAFAGYSRAFSVNPTDPRALEKLDELATILDTWNALVGLLVEGAGQADDAEVVKDLWLRSARIYVTQISDMDKAVHAYQKVLESDSQNMEAIESLEDIYTRTERWEDLISVLRIKVEVAYESGEKENVYRQMAMIYEDMLEQPDEAVTCLKEILNFDPVNANALVSLDKLFAGLERWTDLADNLQQQLNLDGDVDAITELKIRLADLREMKLDETGGAIEIYRDILETDTDNEPAITALERIIDSSEFRLEIAGILEPIYQTLGDWQKLVNVYEIMVQEEETETRKVELLHQMASLYESSGDEPEKAFKTFGRALFLDPADEQTKEQLERMAQVLVLYDDLAALYVEAVEELENEELAAEFHLKIAQIHEEQLQNNDVAIEHYQAVLTMDPMHLEAATALERAYQLTENYPELANTYLKKVEIDSDPE